MSFAPSMFNPFKTLPENILKRNVALSIIFFFGLALACGSAYANEAKKPATRAPGQEKGSYSVQLNAYAEKGNAERFVLKLKNRGYHPYMVTFKTDKLWYKVLIGPYPSRKKALQVVQDFGRKDKLKAIIIPAIHPPHEEAKVPGPQNPPAVVSAPSSSPSRGAARETELGAQGDLSAGSPGPGNDAGYDSIDVVVSLFLAWVKAWREKNADSYLAFYSKDFQLPSGSLEEWKNSRRKALSKNKNIKIEFGDIQILQGKDAVEISFTQKYKSDHLSDVGQKTLVWKKDGDSWKIVKESWKAV